MALTQPPRPFPWIPQLLAKAIAKQALENSVTAVEAAVDRQYNYLAYVIRVLEASPSIRFDVREAAIADVTANPNTTEGQKQLVCILTAFEILSATEKADFIRAYRAFATVGGQGLENIVLENTWQPGHIPPQYPP